MPRGIPNKKSKRGLQKKYVTYPRPYARKTTAKRKTGAKRQTRLSASSVVQSLQADVDVLKKQMDGILHIHRAQFLDSFRGFYLNDFGTASNFADKFPGSMPVLGITVEDLERSVSDAKNGHVDEDPVKDPEAPEVVEVEAEVEESEIGEDVDLTEAEEPDTRNSEDKDAFNIL